LITSIVNARIIDPASEYDGSGVIVFENGKIIDGFDGAPRGEIIDAGGLIAAPGLIDMRVQAGEPGRESKETLATAGRAAAAGGVTTLIITPDTKPAIDDAAMVDYISRRGEAECAVNVRVAGALTKALDGQTLSEIGLMQAAGAVMFSSGAAPIADAQTMRRMLSYAANFNALISNRAIDPSLAAGAVAHESDMSSRLGLTAAPAMAERLMAERDVALAELTGGRLLLDLISSREALSVVRRAKSRDLEVAASVSINHLCLNEVDIGDYRTLGGGLSQVAMGALDLNAFLAALTINPAALLGLECGHLGKGAPADIILIDPHKPWVCDADKLMSKSKNTPFDGRRMTGKCVRTFVGGVSVFTGA